MQKPLKIRRDNDGEVFQTEDGLYGMDWLRKNENNFRQTISGLKRHELRSIADKIIEFLESK
jgi:hypothetical protein